MVSDVPYWLFDVAFMASALIALVGVTAMLIHFRRQRAIQREQEGLERVFGKPSAEKDTESSGKVKHYAATEQSNPDALGWSPADAEKLKLHPENQPKKPADDATPVKTILVADDDPVIAFALKKRLQRLGYDVMRSPDSSHALLGAMKTRPDLVILDVNMPGGNGLAVCEMMATDPENAEVPVIVHTTRNDENTKQRCRELGANYVEKSSKSWEDIQELVGKLLGGPEEPSEPQSSEAPQIDPQLRSPVCGHPRVLCIDDERNELAPIVQRLTSLGVEVIGSKDVEEGFWTCFTEKPHVVVIHIHAPLAELQAALYRFTQHPVTRHLPVLVVKYKGVKTEELTEGLSETGGLKILDSSVGWAGLWRELEKILPIDESDKLAVMEEMSPIGEILPSKRTNISNGGEESSWNDDQSKPMKILCIDDDPVIAKSIALRVKPYGIQLIDAANGTQGFHLGLRERPDLILLDLQMPEGDGHYILSKFKNHPLTKDIPIVILTVETNAGVRRKLISLEASGFLSKPVRWKEFFEEVGRFVTLPKKLIADYKLAEEELLSTS